MFKSLTIWGIVVMALPMISNGLDAAGIPVSTSELENIASGLSTTAEAVIQITGALMAVKGRMRAKGPLKGMLRK